MVLLLRKLKEPGIRNTSPYELFPLELDFTFELTQQGIDPGELSGLIANPNTGERFILDRDGQLFSFGLFGNFLDQTIVQAGMTDSFGGLEWVAQNQFYIAANDNRIYSFDLVSDSAELFTALPEEFQGLENVASDVDNNLVFAINSVGQKELVTVDTEGAKNTAVLDSRMTAYPITGMHAFDGSLFLTSTGHADTPEQAAVIELDYNGVFQRAWSLPSGIPSALLIENTDPMELAIATSDSASILFFEAPVPGSEVIDDPLEEEQGTFEAVAYGAAQIYLLLSDESTPEPVILSYSFTGTLATETEINATIDANTVFEAMDLGQQTQTQTLYLITANVDARKQLLRISQGEQTVTQLPEAYDDFTIVGVDISDDETQAIFVTDESMDDGSLISGLAISIDLNTLEERWRLAIAVPDEDGDFIGLAAPSGVAVDMARSHLYVSSDVDDSMLAVFSLPEAQ